MVDAVVCGVPKRTGTLNRVAIGSLAADVGAGDAIWVGPERGTVVLLGCGHGVGALGTEATAICVTCTSSVEAQETGTPKRVTNF